MRMTSPGSVTMKRAAVPWRGGWPTCTVSPPRASTASNASTSRAMFLRWVSPPAHRTYRLTPSARTARTFASSTLRQLSTVFNSPTHVRHFTTFFDGQKVSVSKQQLRWRMFQPPVVVFWVCPKDVYILRTRQSEASVRNMGSSIGQNTLPHRGPSLDLRQNILDQMKQDKSTRV